MTWQETKWKNEQKSNNGLNTGVIFALAIAGFGAVLSPWLSAPVKIGVGAIGCGLCSYQSVAIKRKRENKSEFLRGEANRLQLLESGLRVRQTELEAKDKQIESSLEALRVSEVEIRSRWSVQEEELRAARSLHDAELKSSKEKQISELAVVQDQLISDVESRIRKLQSDFAAAREFDFKTKQEELASFEQTEFARIGEAIALLQAEKSALKEQIENEKKDFELLLQAERAKHQSDIGLEREAWAKEIEEAEQQMVDAYNKEREELEAKCEQVQQQMLTELHSLKAKLESDAKEQYKSWLVPHIQEMDSKIKEIEALKSTVSMLKEQMAEDRDIKLCQQWGTTHGDRSNAVLIWLKQQGIYCDYVTATVTREGEFRLDFLPWEIGSKAEKALKGLLIAMQVKFGLSEVPKLEPNGEARAWTLVFFPARARAIALSEFYTQQLPEIHLGQTFRDLEPVLREEVAKRVNHQEQLREMMAFRPAKLSRPTSWQITELEMQTVKWFYQWRGLATDGKEENVTTTEGLLYHVYGYSKGRATHTIDPILGESLAQRLARILNVIKATVQTIDSGEDE